jgi:hypothetical protein
VDSDYRFDAFFQFPVFFSKDKASLTDFISISAETEKQMPGGSPFYRYRSGSGNASPHGHLPLAFSRSATCNLQQTGQRAQVMNRPYRIIGLQV